MATAVTNVTDNNVEVTSTPVATYSLDLTSGAVKTQATEAGSGRSGFEGYENREVRIRTFIESQSRIIDLGKLFALPYDANRTLAQAILDGESIALGESFKYQGKVLPLAEGKRVLTLDSCGANWGCIACGSQHGTGIQPSPVVSAKALANVDFWYAVTSKQIFSVSDTCWGRYVKGQALAAKFPARRKGGRK